MPLDRKSRIQKTIPIVVFFIIGGLMVGCLHTSPQQEATAPAVPAPAPCPPDPSAELREEKAVLQQKLAASEKALAASEKALDASEKDLAASREQIDEYKNIVSSLNLRLLDYESQANELQRRTESQQQRLEAAIVEVVRAKAKLRSIESKAETVSTLAEAEIAVKELKARLSGLDKVAAEEVAAAEQLLTMSAEAFKEENFGGALYLANQSKSRVRAIQIQLDKIPEDAAISGETPFSQPLQLKVSKKSNLRAGPGLTEKIVALLEPGALITGYGYKDNWVHVETQEGVVGWIFLSLIVAR